MARPYKGITINEGFNDLGSYEIDITGIEMETTLNLMSVEIIPSSQSRISFFKLYCDVPGETVKPNFRAVFTMQVTTDEPNVVTQYPNAQGYIQLSTPEFPISILPTVGEEKNIRFRVTGPLVDRQDECYLKVEGAGPTMYTLIKDLFVDSGFLCVSDGAGNYYKIIDNDIAVSGDALALYITKEGEVFVYDTTDTWNSIGTLNFYSIQHPENLAVESDGFYTTTGTTGTVTPGELGGAGPFTDCEGYIDSPDVYYFDLTLEVFEGDDPDPFYTNEFPNHMPGSMNYTPVEMTCPIPSPVDSSPPFSDVGDFTDPFLSFLNGLETPGPITLDGLRKKGPIRYITGFPVGSSDAEVDLLQSHVDFWLMNPSMLQNQYLIDNEYTSIFQIANTPKDVFLGDVVDGTDFPLFHAAKFHEVITQNQHYLDNVTAGTLSNYRLMHSPTPDLSGSDFRSQVLIKSENPCGCSDCKSMVSPFSYLMDLLKYAANHVSSEEYSPGFEFGEFLEVFNEYFYQDIGALNVSCETLHDEYCRVRMVSEVLHKRVVAEMANISVARQAQLAEDKKTFLLETYKTLLLRAGTSIGELRDVVAMPAGDARIAAAKRLSDRLGITLQTSSTYNVDTMWLSFAATSLTNANLEGVYGFRDITRPISQATPVSDFETWQENFLRQLWLSEDYKLSDYSREDIAGGYKSNWRPIIDPDIVAWPDFTYNVPVGIGNIYKNRKNDIDAFLYYCAGSSSGKTEISADLRKRILKVLNRNLVTQVIEDDKIWINSGGWHNYYIQSKSQVNTDTNVQLKIDATPMYNPDSTGTAVMRYARVLEYDASTISGTSATLNWAEPCIEDYLASGNVVKLANHDGSIVYITGGSTGYTLTVTSHTDSQFVFGLSPTTPVGFTGPYTVSYYAEVELETRELNDPGRLINALFTTNNFSYDLTSPATSGMTDPFPYTLWANSGTWPTGITAGSLYGKMQELYAFIQAGTTDQDFFDKITEDLHLTVPAFTRLMELFNKCNDYMYSCYTNVQPTNDELYEMASVIRTSANFCLRATWVEEEYEYAPSMGSPVHTALTLEWFWKALKEPSEGSWDGRMQTIPSSVPANPDDYEPYDAIVDPERYDRSEILSHPSAEAYLDLYNARVTELQTVLDDYTTWIAQYQGCEDILNHINTGDENTPYSISPYANFQELLDDITSNDPFVKKAAEDMAWSAFKMRPSVFLTMAAIRAKTEDADPTGQPTAAEVREVLGLFVTAYKKNRLFPTFTSPKGWIEEEIDGSFPGGGSEMVYYYNVYKMKMAPGRSNPDDRFEWQQTLADWNRQPTINPEIVAPEYITNFITTNWVAVEWGTRKATLDGYVTSLEAVINDTLNNTQLFNAFKAQVNLLIERVATFSPTSGNPLLNYFTEIPAKEANGEDVVAIVEQLGMTLPQYRYLQNIYGVLDAAATSSPSGTPMLLDSEYSDIISILIRIRCVNRSYALVMYEYDNNLALSQDVFEIYRPIPGDVPRTAIIAPNQWRSPHSEKKQWLDTLQTRIDQEKGNKTRWAEVLEKTEEATMPILRDAYIKALMVDCESFSDCGERLAKSFMIETKDNCCVKHTRVSFAIETLQGFLFALQNGIYDEYLSDFVIDAPYFKEEWKWIGSYSSWRSAMFVYLYPENILYPTLKRLQSPGFMALAGTLQQATRFTPENACTAAKKYQDYLSDICNLDLICTTSTLISYSEKAPDDCCNNNFDKKEVTYFFAKSILSGKIYWNMSKFYDNIETKLDFWEELNLPAGAEGVGCYVLGKVDLGYVDKECSLYFFYTYHEKNEMKMAFIKKDTMDPFSKWSAASEMPDFPELPANAMPAPAFKPEHHHVTKVIGCQQSWELDAPCFTFVYRDRVTDKYLPVIVVFLNDENKFYFSFNGAQPIFSPGYVTRYNLPLTVLRHKIVDSYGSYNDGLTWVFQGAIAFSRINQWPLPVNWDWVMLPNIVSAYQYRDQENFIIIGTQTQGVTSFSAALISFDQSTNSLTSYIIPITAIGNDVKYISKIAPAYGKRDVKALYGLSCYLNNRSFGATIEVDLVAPTPTIQIQQPYMLSPAFFVKSPIQSESCMIDVKAFAQDVKTNMLNDLSPVTSSPGNYVRPATVFEYLREGYYYVPMLLALDQQQRGQYPSALAWYRTVYDYTEHVSTNRKIYYGFVLENSISNTPYRDADWLLDPFNPHLIASTRANAYIKFTLLNIVQCLNGYADRQFTLDTIETVPIARKLYTTALDLLKVDELDLRPNECQTKAFDCFAAELIGQIPVEYLGLFYKLQQALSEVGLAAEIESKMVDILLVFADGGLDMSEKFEEAFDIVYDITPGTPSTVGQHMDGLQGRRDNSYRYMYALNSGGTFNNAVAQNYTTSVANISGVPVSQVGSNTTEVNNQIGWLSTHIPDNSQPYGFSFASSGGEQSLSGNSVYNPMNPSGDSYLANQAYSNAGTFVAYKSTSQMAYTYSPLIDFEFCMPQNPVFESLRLKGAVELFKIFNCRNIAGMVRELDVFSAATDSSTGIPVIGASGNLIVPGVGVYTPSQYRFRVLIARAKELVNQSQQLESLFLAAMEKQDAENYNQLKAKQDIASAKGTVKLQDLRIRQANDERQVSQLQLDKTSFMESHFTELLTRGQNDFEKQAINLLKEGAGILASVRDAQKVMGMAYLGQSVAFGLAAITTAWKNGGSGYAIASSNSAIASSGSFASSDSTEASRLSTLSSVSAQQASYERRAEEWKFQKELAGKDIEIGNQQIKVADDNVRIVTQERENSELTLTHAQDMLEFLQTKFTNAALYGWMASVLEKSYSYMLNLSTTVARTAERQLYFERQEQAGPFILDDYWEAPTSGAPGSTTDRRGLTGSARLLVDITRLDQFAFDSNKRKLQMTKVISLANNFPSEFQLFRETGVINFQLTNRMFDNDFPGHYIRLINSVKTTVIGLVPVTDGIKATLTADTISYTVIGGNTFQKIPIRRLEVDSVALTSTIGATGVFDMQPMQGELLNPFEGIGIESKWEFKLPPFSNRFDLGNIADVCIAIEYTALDSSLYRYQVLQDIDNKTSFNRAFSMRSDFPDQWFELNEAEPSAYPFGVELNLKRSMFPGGINDLAVNKASTLMLYFTREDGYLQEVDVLDFSVVQVQNNNSPYSGGTTVEGKYDARSVTNSINGSPAVKLRLLFDNKIENREMFSTGKIKDILLIVPCKGELRNYIQ